MRHKIVLIAFIPLLLANILFAQTKEFTAGGLKVIYQPSPKEVVSVRLFIDGGTANYPREKEGIEALALMTAVEGGTLQHDKTAFHTEAEKIGARFSSSSTYDYGTIDMTCLTMFFDKSWQLFSEAILTPAFDEKEFELIRDQAVAGARMSESDPDEHLRNLAMQHVFGGKNYSKIPDGTAESLQKLTVKDVKDYFFATVGKKRCFLVVVGNVKEEDLKKKVEATIARMPEGTPAVREPKQYIKEPGVYREERDIATNYIRGLFTAPSLSEKESAAMRVAMNILQDKFFVELRTKRSLSYAPAAFYSAGVINSSYNVIYISTQDPAQSIAVMTDIINDTKKSGFTEKELKDTKAQFLTNYYMGLETSAAQSLSLGMAEIAGDWSMVHTLTERVNSLTVKDLNKVFSKYTNAIKWTYLGKKEAVKDEDFKQVNYNKKNLPY
ncbi:MAG TPA: pitrilysin family protein [Chitinophagales bacterium]|nr:pitrilysin family protein [Chitinophagales bacterium]